MGDELDVLLINLVRQVIYGTVRLNGDTADLVLVFNVAPEVGHRVAKGWGLASWWYRGEGGEGTQFAVRQLSTNNKYQQT